VSLTELGQLAASEHPAESYFLLRPHNPTQLTAGQPIWGGIHKARPDGLAEQGIPAGHRWGVVRGAHLEARVLDLLLADLVLQLRLALLEDMGQQEHSGRLGRPEDTLAGTAAREKLCGPVCHPLRRW
jgi:hypothetical protein